MPAHPSNPNAVVETVEGKENTVRVTQEDKPGHVLVTFTEEGTGAQPTTRQTVSIHYTGWVKDETKESGRADETFDSSIGRGPFRTPIGIGRVIKGWDEGVTLLKVGGKATFEISPEWAYGSRGFPDAIPPNSTLIFEVELLDVN
jgi:FK506-binding protein 1